MIYLAPDHFEILTDKVEYFANQVAKGHKLGPQQRKRLESIARTLKKSINGQSYYELATELLTA